MNAADIIKEIQINASEWLEMSDNPDLFVAGVLANRIIFLNNHIEYLERRLQGIPKNYCPVVVKSGGKQ